MANICKCCSHPDRKEIDRLIVGGTPHLQISKKFGMGISSVTGHARNHIAPVIFKAEEAKEIIHGNGLLSDMQELVSKTKAILDRAEQTDKSMISLAAIKELRQTYEFFVRLGLHLEERKTNDQIRKDIEQEQSELLSFLKADELIEMRKLMQLAENRRNGIDDTFTLNKQAE